MARRLKRMNCPNCGFWVIDYEILFDKCLMCGTPLVKGKVPTKKDIKNAKLIKPKWVIK